MATSDIKIAVELSDEGLIALKRSLKTIVKIKEALDDHALSMPVCLENIRSAIDEFDEGENEQP